MASTIDNSSELTPLEKNNDGRIVFPPLSRALQLILGLFFLATAIGKALTINHHTIVVRYILNDISPSWNLSFTIASLLILWESLLAVMLIVDIKRRLTLILTGITLIIFTLALMKLNSDPKASDCGCLGAFQTILAVHAKSSTGLIRNAALLWIVGWLYFTNRAKSSHQI